MSVPPFARRFALSVLVLALPCAACSSSGDTTTTTTEGVAPGEFAFVTYTPEEGDQAIANMPATLVLDNGCTWLDVGPNDRPLLALWPADWTAEVVGDGIEIRKSDGTVIPFGEPLLFPGGGTTHESAAEVVTSPIPMRCLDFMEYLVFDVLPATLD